MCPTAPPTKGHLLLCQPYQKCGDKFFDPLQQCCHDDAVVPWNRTQGCGECIYKVCEEQCCAPHTLHNLLIVKPRGQDCQASIAPEDRLCPVRAWLGVMGLQGSGASREPSPPLASASPTLSEVSLPNSLHLFCKPHGFAPFLLIHVSFCSLKPQPSHSA